jgi:hypothetical protein
MKSSKISAAVYASRGDATKILFLCLAIQKFAGKIRRRNSDQKNKLFEPRVAGRIFVFPGFRRLIRQISDEP